MKSLLFCALLAVCASPLFAARPAPEAQIDSFFKTLGEKDASAAIGELCKGTLLETQKGSELNGLSPQFDAAIKTYGKIVRIETVDKKPLGESFIRFRIISYHDSGAPLFWEFMFFKAKDEWQVYVFRFNDDIDKAFTNSN